MRSFTLMEANSKAVIEGYSKKASWGLLLFFVKVIVIFLAYNDKNNAFCFPDGKLVLRTFSLHLFTCCQDVSCS